MDALTRREFLERSMADSVPVRCPACRREHLYAAPSYPCVCGAPVTAPLDRLAEPIPVTHRAWDDDWVPVRCEACGRESEWPHPELGCPCGTTLRIPLRGVRAAQPPLPTEAAHDTNDTAQHDTAPRDGTRLDGTGAPVAGAGGVSPPDGGEAGRQTGSPHGAGSGRQTPGQSTVPDNDRTEIQNQNGPGDIDTPQDTAGTRTRDQDTKSGAPGDTGHGEDRNQDTEPDQPPNTGRTQTPDHNTEPSPPRDSSHGEDRNQDTEPDQPPNTGRTQTPDHNTEPSP
ncbi:hypothetical protein ACIQRL_14165, partial [Streptomyces sp. NPDC091209]